ncbi:MAG TPA: HAMP domain-containing protein, partial [Bacteroidia bacterium]
MGKKKARAPRLPNGNGLLQKSENVNREELLKEAISKLGNGDSNGNGKDKKNPRTDTLLKDKKQEKDIHPKLDRQYIEQISGVIDAAELLRVLTEVKNGNFNVRMPLDQVGISGKICDTLNDIIDTNQRMMEEFTRAGNTIGRQGKLNQRIELPATKGAWATGVESLNRLISDLVHPTIEIAHVISSVAKGNLAQQMSLEIGDHTLQGEFARIAKEVNDMVKQLNLFSMEVTRVAREVGSEGKLGGQAKVKGVAGVWKDLTDSVNQMGSNLTAQVRNIAEVTTAVAKGDLSKKITVDVKGEILELKNTINTMVDQLNSF